jgi:hypothetical protein
LAGRKFVGAVEGHAKSTLPSVQWMVREVHEAGERAG